MQSCRPRTSTVRAISRNYPASQASGYCATTRHPAQQTQALRFHLLSGTPSELQQQAASEQNTHHFSGTSPPTLSTTGNRVRCVPQGRLFGRRKLQLPPSPGERQSNIGSAKDERYVTGSCYFQKHEKSASKTHWKIEMVWQMGLMGQNGAN